MPKRKIKAEQVISKVSELIKTCNSVLPKDIIDDINVCKTKTSNKQEQAFLEIILENAKIAKEKELPLCQDTGISIFFVEMGKIEIEGNKNIEELINESVANVYAEKKLRPSIIDDPLIGKNSCNNLPAFIHIDNTNSDLLKISYMAKGGGSENASATKMLNPSDGFDGIKKFIIDHIREKGATACPPLIIGVGIGGTLDQAVISSKRALLRKIGTRNKKTYYSDKELELKNKLNALNIGAMGLGGECSVLDVFIEEMPRHIATLPVAISMICHSARKGEVII